MLYMYITCVYICVCILCVYICTHNYAHIYTHTSPFVSILVIDCNGTLPVLSLYQFLPYMLLKLIRACIF